MGVKDFRDLFLQTPPSETIDIIEEFIDEQFDSPQSDSGSETSSRRRRRQKLKSPKSHNIRTPTGKRTSGAKSARRLENMNFLLNLVENEESVQEISLDDFVDSTMSKFSQLFSDKENMKMWNEFASASEEEQRCFLESMRKQRQQREQQRHNGQCDVGCPGDACFRRIDSELRKLLSRRNIPYGLVSRFEAELIAFFQERPHSVYVGQLADNFERLTMHAVCQYLDLVSKSIDKGANRHTMVENCHDQFDPPETLLSQYLLAKPAC